jgi:hypothetical protein
LEKSICILLPFGSDELSGSNDIISETTSFKSEPDCILRRSLGQ